MNECMKLSMEIKIIFNIQIIKNWFSTEETVFLLIHYRQKSNLMY